jgi:hypothetical protein
MEKRSAKRAVPIGFNRAEIKLTGIPLYQFKLKDVSDNGASLLVKENSDMMTHLEVSQSLEIKVLSDSLADLNGYYKAKIKHITKIEEGRYKGHYMVGMRMLAK